MNSAIDYGLAGSIAVRKPVNFRSPKHL